MTRLIYLFHSDGVDLISMGIPNSYFKRVEGRTFEIMMHFYFFHED